MGINGESLTKYEVVLSESAMAPAVARFRWEIWNVDRGGSGYTRIAHGSGSTERFARLALSEAFSKLVLAGD